VVAFDKKHGRPKVPVEDRIAQRIWGAMQAANTCPRRSTVAAEAGGYSMTTRAVAMLIALAALTTAAPAQQRWQCGRPIHDRRARNNHAQWPRRPGN